MTAGLTSPAVLAPKDVFTIDYGKSVTIEIKA